LIYLFLAAAALMAFWQVFQCDFIYYDDPAYVTENVHIRHGITIEAIRWAFTTGQASNWHPLTWMSHMLDVQLFGLTPRWHHLTNLLFHIANTLLLFFVFQRMTKAPWRSAFVAALFALHPLHVESVAWVAERKDVLSAFFWMLTMCAYIHYVERPRLKSYLAVLTFFALGLMAKPMLVTLPFVLLLMDYWPLGRMQGEGSTEREGRSAKQNTSVVREALSANKKKGKSGKKLARGSGSGQISRGVEIEEKPADDKYQWALIRPLIREKIPFFAMTALSCVATFIAQQKGGAVQSIEVFTPGVRIANAFVSYILYIGKMVWPRNLAVFYPHPGLWHLWQVLVAVLLLGAVTLTVIRTAKRFPYLAVGWLWFTGTLVPVIGIVQVGAQAMADRYTYIPLIGLFIMTAWGIPELLKEWQPTHPPRKEVLFASSAIILACLFVVTWTQVGYWRNSIALYDHALKVTDRNDTIYNARGVAYTRLGSSRQAIADYDRAVEINPEHVDAYHNRGVAYAKLGNFRQAIADYDRAIRINPEHAWSYHGRGAAYAKLGNRRQAIEDYGRAIEMDPEYAEAYNNRGVTYGEIGDLRQAISNYNRAIEIDPGYAEAYNNRGVAYDGLGDHRRAISDFDRAVEINPELAQVYNNRGLAFGRLGNPGQAISNYDRAIEINPKYADAYSNRAAAYGSLRNYTQAVEDYDKAVEIDPGYAKAYYNRGVAYSELGNHRQAIEDYDRAVQIDPGYAKAYYNRGVAYSELGNHRQAIEDYDRAVQIDPGYAKAYYNRGVAYGELGNHRQEIEDYDRAVQINPEYADAYNNRGVAYAKLGNRDRAIEDMKTAAKFGNEDARNSLRSIGINW